MKENIKYFSTVVDANGYIINDIPFTCYIKENRLVLFNNKLNKMIIILNNKAIFHNMVDVVFNNLADADGYIINDIPFSCYIKENQQFLECNYENCKIVVKNGVAVIKEMNDIIRYTATSKITPYSSSALPHIISNDFDLNTGKGVIKFTTDVTSIGNYAFQNCRGLTSITIPNSVTYIGRSVFGGCDGLSFINVASDNLNYCSVDGVLFNKGKTFIIQYPAGKQGSYTIPDGVTSIGESAFNGCEGLTSVTIPNSVARIGNYAFSNCDHLTLATIPNSVTSIGDYAFHDCGSLTSVTIPNSVTSIGGSAFYSCEGLTSVIIPNSVTRIGEWTFAYCEGLTSVTIPNSITRIGNYAFYNCAGLASLTIPNSITRIGNEAFVSCRSLTTISYTGTVSQYNSITKGSSWHTNVPATHVYCLGENPPAYTPI